MADQLDEWTSFWSQDRSFLDSLRLAFVPGKKMSFRLCSFTSFNYCLFVGVGKDAIVIDEYDNVFQVRGREHILIDFICQKRIKGM